MDRSLFTPAMPGTLIAISVPDKDWAFIPEPLPTSWTMPPDLWPLLTAAHAGLARLDGAGRYMPNPDLLLRPLQEREAIRSSSLEGTYATAEEMLLYELAPREPTSGEDPANAWREVSNYRRALTLGQRLLQENSLPLSLRFVRTMHETLLTGVRGKDKAPGEFRRHQVHIGAGRRFIPPPPSHLPECLDQFEKYLHLPSDIDPLIRCFLVHYQFETIHPFADGNGRVGRLLLSLMIYRWCELNAPWLYLSAYFDRYKDDYINSLFRVSTHGDWRTWVRLCLMATIDQAKDSMRRVDRMIALRHDYHARVAGQGGSIRLQPIVEHLFGWPALTIPSVARDQGVSYPTAKADVARLVRAGILAPSPRQERPQVFLASEIVDIAFGEALGT